MTPARAAAHRAVAEYVRHFFDAHLNANAVSIAPSSTKPLREPLPGRRHDARASRGRRRRRSATTSSFSKLISGRGDEAIAELAAAGRELDPAHPLLTEVSLGRLCVSLLYTWNLAEQTLPLVEFSLELYPSSGGGKALLAETHAIALRNYPAAIAAYEEVLDAAFPAIQRSRRSSSGYVASAERRTLVLQHPQLDEQHLRCGGKLRDEHRSRAGDRDETGMRDLSV